MKNFIGIAFGLMVPAFAAFAEMRDIHDGHIADIVVTASGIAIDTGNLAQSRSSSAEIKAYARRMIDGHTEISQSAIELATRLKVPLQDNPISKSLKADGKKDLARLQGFHDKKFDKTYINQMVAFYQNVLDMIDNRLMPNAGSEELKALLYNLFSPFSLHLEQAQQIQEALHQPGLEKRSERDYFDWTSLTEMAVFNASPSCKKL